MVSSQSTSALHNCGSFAKIHRKTPTVNLNELYDKNTAIFEKLRLSTPKIECKFEIKEF